MKTPPRNAVSAVSAVLVVLAVAGRASAQDCYQSTILSPSPFMGNNDETFKLADGSLWKVKYEYEYLYEYRPLVIVCPSRGKLIVGRKSLNIQLVARAQKGAGSPKEKSSQAGEWEVFEETSLQGSISGTVEKGQIFKTTSGSVYEVTGLTLQLVLELQPDVMVLRNGETYKLIVKGFGEPVICRRLNRGISPAKKSSQAGEWEIFEETTWRAGSAERWSRVEYSRQLPAMCMKLQGSRCSWCWSFSRQ
jgi:hypothetical protein